jgi:hypothetical protein
VFLFAFVVAGVDYHRDDLSELVGRRV